MAKKNKRTGVNANDYAVANAAADVQYGDQISQIGDLYGEAATQRVSDIQAAKQGAHSVIAFAKAQRPVVAKVYQRGQNVVDANAADVKNAFGTLAPDVTAPYQAIAAREDTGAHNRINESRIAAQDELTSRAAAAKGGMQLAINQARSDWRTNKSKLDNKLTDLLGRRGSYVAGQLASAANTRASEETRIKVANIGADATRDAASTRAAAGDTKAKDNAATKEKDQREKDRKARVKTTNEFQVKMTDAIGDLTRLANTSIPIPQIGKDGKPVLSGGKPVMVMGKAPKQNILTEMRHLGYSPQEIAIARVLNARRSNPNAKLSSTDLNYLKAKGVKPPRGWLTYNQAYDYGYVTGPPSPGVA